MTQLYLKSTTGSNSNNGTTWALSKATLAGVTAIDAVADTINISQAHSETTAAAIAIDFAGTVANPTKVICVNDAAAPPTAVATSAVVATTSVGDMNFTGSFYCYGVQYVCDGFFNLIVDSGVDSTQHFDSCAIRLSNNGSAGRIMVGAANTANRIVFSNTTFKFGGAGNLFTLGKNVEFRGGSIEAGSSTPAALFSLPADRTGSRTVVDGFDFSNLAATVNFFGSAGVASSLSIMRNCKLPASWSGSLVNGGVVNSPGQRFEMYNCAGTGVNYALWIHDYSGSIIHETTNIKTGGASDGVTGLAWKMTSSANATYPAMPLFSGEMASDNYTPGTPITVTVDILHDSVTALTNAEVWLEVQYLGSSGSPVSTFISNAKADLLVTAAAQATSTATWTTTGLTNPNKQKLSVTFTPQMKGFLLARVRLAKPSKTIYVDPLLQVS